MRKKKRVPTFAEAVVDIIDLCMFEDHSEKECKCCKRVEVLLQARVKRAEADGFAKACGLLSIKANKYRKG